MNPTVHPIFYSPTGKRCMFVWLTRLLVFLAATTIIVALLAVVRKTTTVLPKLMNPNEVYKRVLNHEDPLIIQSKQTAQLQNALRYLAKPDTLRRRSKHPTALRGALGVEVRAGFYVNWMLSRIILSGKT